MLIEQNNLQIIVFPSSDQVILRNVYNVYILCTGEGLKLAAILLTTGEDEVAFMFIQRKLSKLHRLADYSDVTPAVENVTRLLHQASLPLPDFVVNPPISEYF